MGRLIIAHAITIDGAFDAPAPEPEGWLVMDPDWQRASLEMWQAADAMLIGRRTYEGSLQRGHRWPTSPGTRTTHIA